MPFAHKLAEWIHAFAADDVTPTAELEAKLHLLDSLGCALAALDEPPVRGTLAAVRTLGGPPECTLIGSGERTSAPNAALANGVMVRTLDLNDAGTAPRAMGHCSDNIPVALAVGERLGSPGRDVLAAIVLGYEVQCLLPRRPAHLGPWDASTQEGIIVPAMAGWLMGLPVDQLADALALSAAHCATLTIVRRGQLSAAKSISAPFVAHNALVATTMAAAGVTGPPTALEELANATLGGADMQPLIAPRDGDWRIMDVAIKAFPAVVTGQSAIGAALQVRQAVANPDEIERVEVAMADIPWVRSQVQDEERRHPTTRETADHSFPFVVAAALRDGEFGLQQYAGERWSDPAIVSLMARMQFELDPGLNDSAAEGAHPCRVTVTLHDGRRHTAELHYAPGHPKNRLGPEGIQAKFHRYAAALPERKRAAVARLVGQLEKEPDVRELMALLAVND